MTAYRPLAAGQSCFRVQIRDERMTWAPIISALDSIEAAEKVRDVLPDRAYEVIGAEYLHPSTRHRGEAAAVDKRWGSTAVALDIAAARAAA